MPSSTIPEPPIRSASTGKSNRLETQLPSPADSEEDEDDSGSELHLDVSALRVSADSLC